MVHFASTVFVVVLMAPRCSTAQIRAPFPAGYSMGNFGTLLWEDGMSGRQPWTPVSFLRDSLRFGFGASIVDVYDDMDEGGGSDIRHATAGGWVQTRIVSIKACYQYFNALDIYFEQLGAVSIGTSRLPWLSPSIEVRGMQAGLYGCEDERETVAQIGASLWIPLKAVAFSLVLDHVTLEDAAFEGFAPEPSLRIGVHTRRHRLGALGATAEIVFADNNPRVRFAVGQELRIRSLFGICAGVVTEPFMVAFGVSFAWKGYGTSVSLVHHPVLGWSKGFAVEYAR